jgi:outer membrane protein assembly factor BamE (lipoprotein component of BamABCDE complex)
MIYLLFGLLISCSTVYRNHGFTPTDEELSSIVLGATTRSSVEASIGVPSTSSLTKSDGIYYVSSKWRHFGAAAPKPVERQIVSIQFDSAGVVTNVSRYGLDDGKVIVLSRRVTEGGSGEISFIRQMMGNVGRMDAEDFFGDSN